MGNVNIGDCGAFEIRLLVARLIEKLQMKL